MAVSPTLQLTDQEFKLMQKLVYDRAGIAIGDAKVSMLSNRLRKRLRELELESFMDYYHLLQKCKDDAEELSHFLSAVSTNETYFFRNDALWQYVGGELIDWFVENNKAKNPKRATFWSAASSSGEEAYTLAMVLREKLPNFPTWHVEICGTDISHNILKKAQAGQYNEYAVRKLSKQQVTQFFTHDKANKTYTLKDDLRKMVKFTSHNLRNTFKKDYFDVVFLRNVMMYFDLPMKKLVMKSIYAALKPGGFMITGDVDPMRDGSGLLEYSKLEFIRSNTYQKPLSGPAPV